jgi:hypothetical protein
MYAASAPYLDGSDNPRPKRTVVLEAGPAFAISSDPGVQPQVGGYMDVTRSLQVGFQARISPLEASFAYDLLPQVSAGIRMLWLADETAEPIRNSEYFGASLGGYFAYDFRGARAGLRPFGTLALGKYWMPFDNRPFGLDLDIELTRYLSGHLPGRTELMFVTCGIDLFYELP